VKVGEQCLYLAQMKEKVSKQKQREQLGIGLKVRNSG
jgi:hypothetical protein